MKPEIKARWLAALRSGDYIQGHGQLREGNTFCCLGVLCDLYAKETGVEWKKHESERYAFDHHLSFLPDSVMHWAGLVDHDPIPKLGGASCTLSYFNDSRRASFNEIADHVERGL